MHIVQAPWVGGWESFATECSLAHKNIDVFENWNKVHQCIQGTNRSGAECTADPSRCLVLDAL
jgi:hypothetical protein